MRKEKILSKLLTYPFWRRWDQRWTRLRQWGHSGPWAAIIRLKWFWLLSYSPKNVTQLTGSCTMQCMEGPYAKIITPVGSTTLRRILAIQKSTIRYQFFSKNTIFQCLQQTDCLHVVIQRYYRPSDCRSFGTPENRLSRAFSYMRHTFSTNGKILRTAASKPFWKLVVLTKFTFLVKTPFWICTTSNSNQRALS